MYVSVRVSNSNNTSQVVKLVQRQFTINFRGSALHKIIGGLHMCSTLKSEKYTLEHNLLTWHKRLLVFTYELDTFIGLT